MRFIYDFILVVICSPSELHTHKSSRSATTAIWIHKDLSLDKIFNVELTLTWITYLVTDENKSWYWDIIYIFLCVILNSCHCYCWLPSTHVIFWMHLHRRTCKERDNTEYCPVAWNTFSTCVWIGGSLSFESSALLMHAVVWTCFIRLFSFTSMKGVKATVLSAAIWISILWQQQQLLTVWLRDRKKLH